MVESELHHVSGRLGLRFRSGNRLWRWGLDNLGGFFSLDRSRLLDCYYRSRCRCLGLVFLVVVSRYVLVADYVLVDQELPAEFGEGCADSVGQGTTDGVFFFFVLAATVRRDGLRNTLLAVVR